MKFFKIKILTGYNIILAALLGLLGFSTSCEPISRTEYGTPHAKFIVKGKISSAVTNQPITNIKVQMERDSMNSTNQGLYQVVDNYGSPATQSYTLHIKDIDGIANGEFQNLDTVVDFKDAKFSGGDGHWNNGETQKEFNISLKPKK